MNILRNGWLWSSTGLLITIFLWNAMNIGRWVSIRSNKVRNNNEEFRGFFDLLITIFKENKMYNATTSYSHKYLMNFVKKCFKRSAKNWTRLLVLDFAMTVERLFSLPYPFLALLYILFSSSIVLKVCLHYSFWVFLTFTSVIKLRFKLLGSFHQVKSLFLISNLKFCLWEKGLQE